MIKVAELESLSCADVETFRRILRGYIVADGCKIGCKRCQELQAELDLIKQRKEECNK